MNRLILFLCVLLCACNGAREARRARVTLDDVASYINERPDSALVVLQGVDSTALTTRALQAKYTLLRVMALDKNYMDIYQPGLLDPAIRYYSRYGSADEKLKVLYYQGRVLQHVKDLNGAAVAYSQAEEYVEKAEDKHAVAVLFEAFACVYNLVHNTQKQQDYIEKELIILEESGDPMYGSVLGELALVYHSKKEWAKADSLYRIAIAQSESYPAALSTFLSNYAWMKVIRPDKDPVGAIELLDHKRALAGGALTPKEAGVYAYALALTGEKAASESLRSQLLTFTGRDRYDVLSALELMAVHEGDMAAAFKYLSEAYSGEESLIIETLTDSVTQALKDHEVQVAQIERERKLRWRLVSLLVILLSVIVTLLLILRERRIRSERDRLVAIRMSLEQDLHEREVRSSEQSSELFSRLDQLRKEMQQERVDRLRNVGKYSYRVWMGQNRRLSDQSIVQSLKKDLREIFRPEMDLPMLERRLDKELDGLVSDMKRDLGLDGNPDELRLLCYMLIGLKSDMIAELLGIEINNVYIRKHRLMELIEKKGKPEYRSVLE